MEHIPIVNLICNPFPGFISSGNVVYGPDEKHPERIFSTFVAMFIEEGVLYFTEGDQSYTLTAGQWFIQTPGIRHYGHRPSGTRTTFHFVHFLPQGDWSIVANEEKKADGPPPFNQLDSGEGVRLPKYELQLPMRGVYRPSLEWDRLFQKLKQEPPSAGGVLHKQAGFLELLERLIAFGDAPERSATQPIQQAIDYIRQHYAEPLTVMEVAARFHFSTDYLTRQIKQIAGMAPFSLMTHCRMNEARHLLVHTNKSIQQIGFDVGYRDLPVFSRMFKKNVGLSPSQYRSKHWGNR